MTSYQSRHRRCFRSALQFGVLFASLAAYSESADIYVIDYGIIGQGHDLAIIQKAIESAQQGDRVLLPEGTLNIDGPIHARCHVALVGAGIDKTVVRRLDEGETGPMIQIGSRQADNGVDGVEVTQLTLDANHSPRAPQGIRAEFSHGHHVHGVLIQNLVANEDFGSHGIHFRNDVDDSLIERCRFENIGVDDKFGCAVRLSRGSERNRVIKNQIHRTGRGGVFAEDGSTHTIVRENVIAESGLYDHGKHDGLSIELWKNCGWSLIEDNTMDHWLSLDRADRTAVRRNRIVADDLSDCKFAGLELADGNDVVMTDNTVGQGAVVGLSISAHKNDGVRRALISRNKVGSARDVGLQVHDGDGVIRQVYFYDNEITGVTNASGFLQAAGVRLLAGESGGGVNHIVFDRNQITANNATAVLVNAGPREGGIDALVFTNNTVTKNEGQAVRWSGDLNSIEWDSNRIGEDQPRPSTVPTRLFVSEAPTVRIDLDPPIATVGQEVGYRIAYSDAWESTPDSILWDLGVGIPAVDTKGVSIFHAAGEYQITVIAWDRRGRAAHHTTTLTVE